MSITMDAICDHNVVFEGRKESDVICEIATRLSNHDPIPISSPALSDEFRDKGALMKKNVPVLKLDYTPIQSYKLSPITGRSCFIRIKELDRPFHIYPTFIKLSTVYSWRGNWGIDSAETNAHWDLYEQFTRTITIALGGNRCLHTPDQNLIIEEFVYVDEYEPFDKLIEVMQKKFGALPTSRRTAIRNNDRGVGFLDQF